MCSVQFHPAGQLSQVKFLLSFSTLYVLFPKLFDDIFNDPVRRVYVSCTQEVHLILSCVAICFTLALLQLINKNNNLIIVGKNLEISTFYCYGFG